MTVNLQERMFIESHHSLVRPFVILWEGLRILFPVRSKPYERTFLLGKKVKRHLKVALSKHVLKDSALYPV